MHGVVNSMNSLSSTSYLLLAAAGFLAGFVDSIAGGGGIITVPALLWVGFPPHLALGTNKLQSSFGSLTASINYTRSGLVVFRETLYGIFCTAVGAATGTVLVQCMPASVLASIIPLLLAIVFIYTMLSPRLGVTARQTSVSSHAFYTIAGLAIGFYDGFFGPGTGSFWTLAFVLLLGYDFRIAAAHTKILNFTSNIVALVLFAIGGKVVLAAGLLMGVCEIAGAAAGSRLVIRKEARFVRAFFLIVVAFTLIRLLYVTYS